MMGTASRPDWTPQVEKQHAQTTEKLQDVVVSCGRGMMHKPAAPQSLRVIADLITSELGL